MKPSKIPHSPEPLKRCRERDLEKDTNLMGEVCEFPSVARNAGSRGERAVARAATARYLNDRELEEALSRFPVFRPLFPRTNSK